jgi:RHH-type rel operon transcriptional repressor/antitoxin RelB
MTLAIELPNDVEQRLAKLANLNGRSVIDYVQALILERLDDIEDIRLADSELKKIRTGHIKTTPLAEVMKRYGMEN